MNPKGKAGIIVYALMRFRWREGEPDRKQVAGDNISEIVWAAIPCVIVVANECYNRKMPATSGKSLNHTHADRRYETN